MEGGGVDMKEKGLKLETVQIYSCFQKTQAGLNSFGTRSCLEI